MANEEGEKAYALHTDIKSERPEQIIPHKGKIRTLYIFNHFGIEASIEFRKRKALPYTHRVFVGGVARDWLEGRYKPSLKTARFFYDKYAPNLQMVARR